MTTRKQLRAKIGHLEWQLASAEAHIKTLQKLITKEKTMNKVQIEERLIHRIGIREWGRPSLCVPGKMWRSKIHQTISCMVPHATDATMVTTETLPLEVIGIGELSIMPDHWRDALWEYVQEYRQSGCCLGPFLRITEADRKALVRKIAEGLKDEIGCLSIAHSIGQLASVDFETVQP